MTTSIKEYDKLLQNHAQLYEMVKSLIVKVDHISHIVEGLAEKTIIVNDVDKELSKIKVELQCLKDEQEEQ